MPDRLVYLATGRDEFHVQAEYAVLSALAWREDHDLEVVVFTDRPGAFRLGDRVRPVALSPELARSWRGRWDFFFRMKPAALREVLRAHPLEKALLVDADTYFRAPVAEAFRRVTDATAVMHVREYLVATHDTPQMRRFRRRTARARFRGEPVGLDCWMWNSGAVGLTGADADLVDAWIAFLDEVYPTNPRPLVEQYGLSFLLQRRGHGVAPVDDVLFHYHDDKERHLAAIRPLLAATRAMAPEAALRHVRAHPIAIAGPPPPEPGRWRRAWASAREKVRVRAARLRGGGR